MSIRSFQTLTFLGALLAASVAVVAQPAPDAVARDVEALLTPSHGSTGAFVLADADLVQRMREHPAAYLPLIRERLGAPFDTVAVPLIEDLAQRRRVLEFAYLLDSKAGVDLARSLEIQVRPIVQETSDEQMALIAEYYRARRAGDLTFEIDSTAYQRAEARVLAAAGVWSRTLDVIASAGDISRASAAYDLIWDYSTPGWGRDTATFAWLAARKYLRGVAFILPPATDVEPARVCMGRGPSTNGGPVALFGGLTRSAEVVHLPVGPDNYYTSSLGREIVQPPPIFYQEKVAERRPLYQWEPDRTPVSVSTVDLQPDETVTWTLLGRQAVAGAASPRCDGTDPLVFEALPGAVALEAGAEVRVEDDRFAISGRPHTLRGVPEGGAAGRAALIAEDDPTTTAVLRALSDRQRSRFDGGIEVGPFEVSPRSWASVLSARPDVVIDGSTDRRIGSADAPVVAYAPAGARLDGGTTGWGVLVADGPLVIEQGARWTGLVIARDGLDVSGSATVVGGAAVHGSLRMQGGGQILYSPSALALAREAAPHAE